MNLFEWIKAIFLLFFIILIGPGCYTLLEQHYHEYFHPIAYIGIINFSGIITEASTYLNNIHYFFKNPEIKALLLCIDCPGSPPGTSESLYREISTLKKMYRKPVVVLIENICTAGGYAIACAADYIIAPSTAFIGAIGINTIPSLLFDEPFIAQQYLYNFKNSGSLYKEVHTENEAFALKKLQEDYYTQMIEYVARNRNLNIKTATTWTRTLFSGKQALSLGLIDAIGSRTQAIYTLKKYAHINGDIVWIKSSSTILTILYEWLIKIASR